MSSPISGCSFALTSLNSQAYELEVSFFSDEAASIMKPSYSVYRAESAQNAFLICDCLKQTNLEEIDLASLYELLLQEKRDDLLLLLNGQKEGEHLEAHYLVFGCDGQFGEFCGNGARASAAYLYETYPNYSSFTLKTSKAICPLKKLDGGHYAAILPAPSTDWNPNFISDWEMFRKKYPTFSYIEAIEPHLTWEASLKDDELFALGKKLNAQKDLFPLGINLNAWQKIDNQTLFVKTYERGVQRLTLSCGTGSIASSKHANLQGEILIQTPGGSFQMNWTPFGIEISGKSFIEKTPLKIFTSSHS